MKKLIAFVLAIALLGSLAGCAGTTVVVGNCTCPPERHEPIATPTEAPAVENPTEENAAEGVLKTGLAIVTGIHESKSADGDANGEAKYDVTVEQAAGGTLVLDEIGDMSLAAQAKVLRVLQEKKLSRVGSDKDIIVDVRVLAATNKNLKAEIEKGTFREDLYHRLSVIVINVPTLDDRKTDIPLLVDHFIGQICSETGMPPREVEPEAMKLLVEKSWTGNIRELRNVVERLLILSGSRITAEDVKSYVL